MLSFAHLLAFGVTHIVEAPRQGSECRCRDAYGLNGFDAHLLAYAEHYGCPTLYSEDFQDGRYYGTVRAVNPFT